MYKHWSEMFLRGPSYGRLSTARHRGVSPPRGPRLAWKCAPGVRWLGPRVSHTAALHKPSAHPVAPPRHGGWSKLTAVSLAATVHVSSSSPIECRLCPREGISRREADHIRMADHASRRLHLRGDEIEDGIACGAVDALPRLKVASDLDRISRVRKSHHLDSIL